MGLCTIGLALSATVLISSSGDRPVAGFVVGVVILVAGGLLAGRVLRPRLIEVCAIAIVCVAGAWLTWSPSGEAGPRERSMDWRAVGGVVLEGCVPAALWGLAAFGGDHTRRQRADSRSNRDLEVPIDRASGSSGAP